MKKHLKMLGAYNAWVNQRLYDAAAKLSDSDYRRDCGAFFRSLHGTLNHLLIGDRIWMHRFTGEGNEPAALDEILYDEFVRLREAREDEDERILSYVRSLTEADLAGTVSYRTTRNPTDIEQELVPLLIHFFNHQTHHRGQAHCILTLLAGEAPSFDLFVFQRLSGISIVRGQGGTLPASEKRS
jgi:uncharacterized damage-inducible protein DinB